MLSKALQILLSDCTYLLDLPKDIFRHVIRLIVSRGYVGWQPCRAPLLDQESHTRLNHNGLCSSISCMRSKWYRKADQLPGGVFNQHVVSADAGPFSGKYDRTTRRACNDSSRRASN